MVLPDTLHRSGHDTGQQRLCASDPQFAGDWIGEEPNLFYACPHIVEDRDTSFEEGTTIECRLDALRAAVKQANAEQMLEVCDGLRNDRLRHAELLCSLAHAFPLRHCHRETQVLQFEPMSSGVGGHRCPGHSRILSRHTKIELPAMARNARPSPCWEGKMCRGPISFVGGHK